MGIRLQVRVVCGRHLLCHRTRRADAHPVIRDQPCQTASLCCVFIRRLTGGARAAEDSRIRWRSTCGPGILRGDSRAAIAKSAPVCLVRHRLSSCCLLTDKRGLVAVTTSVRAQGIGPCKGFSTAFIATQKRLFSAMPAQVYLDVGTARKGLATVAVRT